MNEQILAEKKLDNGLRALIVTDIMPPDPLDTDDPVMLLFWSKQYELGSRNNFHSPHDFIGGGDLIEDNEDGAEIPFYERWQRALKMKVVPPASDAIIPIVATDFGSGGWRIAATEMREDFAERLDHWDDASPLNRQVFGFGYVTPHGVDMAFGDDAEWAKKAIHTQMRVYENYLNGAVFGYVIEQTVEARYTHPVTGKEETTPHTVHIDSCFGYHTDAQDPYKLRDELGEWANESIDSVVLKEANWEWK